MIFYLPSISLSFLITRPGWHVASGPSLNWVKSNQKSGVQQAYNIPLPTHSHEWVGFFCLKEELILMYVSGSLGPAKKTKNICVLLDENLNTLWIYPLWYRISPLMQCLNQKLCTSSHETNLDNYFLPPIVNLGSPTLNCKGLPALEKPALHAKS